MLYINTGLHPLDVYGCRHRAREKKFSLALGLWVYTKAAGTNFPQGGGGVLRNKYNLFLYVIN